MDKFDFDDEASQPHIDQHMPDDHNIYADEEYEKTSSRKWLVIFLAVLLLAAGGFGAWWFSVPHDAAGQIQAAEESESDYLRKKTSLEDKKQAVAAGKVRGKWRNVYEKFPATDDQAVTARSRLAQFDYAEGELESSRSWYDSIVSEFPTHEKAARSAAKVIESLSDQAATAGDEALELYEQAVKKCDQYREAFDADPVAARQFDIEACRVLDDKIIEPPIRVIRRLEEFLKRNTDGEFVDEVLYRLARRHQMINELETAEELYARIIEEFPQSEFLKDAEIQRAEVVGLLDPARGEELWRQLAEKYGNDDTIKNRAERKASQLAEKAEQARQDELADKAAKARQQADSERYGSGGGGGGGGGPVDTSFGKPIPPREMLADFIAQKLDAQHYSLDVKIDPQNHRIEVSGSVKLLNAGDDKSDFLLMLSQIQEIDSMEFEGQAVKFDRPQGKDDVLHVLLNENWEAGSEGELKFSYSATVKPSEMPGELNDETLDSLGSLDCPGRQMPVNFAGNLCDSAEIAGDVDMNSLALQINETGYSISPASWYPVTILGDLFTSDITCTITEGSIITFSGHRESFESSDGFSKGRWVCESPMFGLYFAYGPYRIITRQHETAGITLSAMVGEQLEDRAEEYLDVAGDVLEFYVTHFGPYPYSKLDIVQVDLPPIIGGVGPAGMIFLHSSAMKKLDHAPVNLMAHEMSHHWWGNQIPINLIDPRYSQWLSEGFATYSDAMYTQYNKGDEEFEDRIYEMGKLYLMSADSAYELPITKTFMGQSSLYRPVVYEKGALVLHALRFVLGDDKFFKLLKDYADSYAFTPSNIDDFVALASESSGQSLEWFFNEWLELPGCPVLNAPEFTQVAPSEDGQPYKVTVTITQPDRLTEMPIDIYLHGEDGRETIVRAKLDKRKTVVELDCDFSVESVTLDDHLNVLHRIDGGESSWSPQSSEVDQSL